MKTAISFRTNKHQIFAAKILRKVSKYISQNKAYLKSDPNFLLMKYLGRFLLFRSLAYRFAPQSRQRLNTAKRVSVSENCISLDHDINDAILEIRENGYYSGLRLASSHVNEILEFAFSNPCYGERKQSNTLFLTDIDAVQKQNLYRVASYSFSQENCKAVQEIIYDANVLALARSYLGREPVYTRSDLLWSFPGDMDDDQKIAAAQVFHCDINDYRSIKFFFYLTDVEEADGSHTYIKGTHRKRSLIDQILGQRIASKADEKLLETYDSRKVKTLFGSAGLGFAGDPYCIHRGDTVKLSCRLLLQVEYSFYNYNSYYNHVEDGV